MSNERKWYDPDELTTPHTGGDDADRPFPKGTWRGTIDCVRIHEVLPGDPMEWRLQSGPQGAKVYFCDSVEVASIQLGSIESMHEGQPEVGDRKFFDDGIYLSINGVRWFENIPEDKEHQSWRLNVAANRLSRLAYAVGAVDTSPDGKVSPVPDFDKILRQTPSDPEELPVFGEPAGLAGLTVVFEIGHRNFKRKDGTKGVEARILTYRPVKNT